MLRFQRGRKDWQELSNIALLLANIVVYFIIRGFAGISCLMKLALKIDRFLRARQQEPATSLSN